jgi:glycosyltransferase involved in cell wall biosynthesis
MFTYSLGGGNLISVIIAVSKGSKHIQQQILSVLSQISYTDEVIVSDDRPGGITELIVKKIAAEDSRVIWVEGKNKGNTANLVNAIRHSKGDKIFFCDGKDVWLPDKVKRVSEAFAQGADMVIHNAYITDENLNITDYSFFEKYSVNKNPVLNVFNNSFLLGCMAIDRKLLKKIMPIPRSVPLISQWIGILSCIYGKAVLVDIPVMYCRVKNKDSFEHSLRSKNKSALISKLYKRIFFHN